MNVKLAIGVAGIVVCLAGTAVSLGAHHAFNAEFDANKPVTLEGQVTSVEWTNPHVWVNLDVKGQNVSIKVLAAVLDGADAKALRETMDKLKGKLKSAAIVLAAVEGGRVQLAAGVTADRMGTIKAGELVNFVAQQVGGKGGGKPDLAMAGGSDPSRLDAALASVQAWVAERT